MSCCEELKFVTDSTDHRKKKIKNKDNFQPQNPAVKVESTKCDRNPLLKR